MSLLEQNIDGETGDVIENIMYILMEKRSSHKLRGENTEADHCLKTFNHHKNVLYQKRLKETLLKHQEEKYKINMAREEEIKHFNRFVADSKSNYEQEAEKRIQKIAEKQAN